MEEKVCDMLAELCDDEVVRENRNVDLFETGLLDSLGFAELLVRIEEDFSVVIFPSEMAREDLNTPSKIIDVITARSK